MRRVVHLMPYDGIGGVERAAATAQGARHGDLVLERMFVFEDVLDRSKRGATFDPRAFWAAAGRLVRSEPDLVILSLWRSVIVGGLAWLQGCRAPMVLFLHNARDAHALDRIVTRAAARQVSAIWADSATTLAERLPNPPRVPARVISYMLDRPRPVRGEWPDPTPDLIFWGRLAAQKDPLRMLSLFARLHASHPEATLTVIGPDGGLEDVLRKEIARGGLERAVTLAGPLPREHIASLAARASFYLQTSRHEGMGLSVIEAMQAGLVPVVTPVGEIAHYTVDGHNALWIGSTPDDDARVVARIEAALDAPGTWRKFRAAATRTLVAQPLYAADVMAAAAETLDALPLSSVSS
jgi:glycosyltransferase involved in cell wall biosynthesis